MIAGPIAPTPTTGEQCPCERSSPPLVVRFTTAQGCCSAALAGELDIATAPVLSGLADAVQRCCGRLHVNLAGLCFLDAGGARSLRQLATALTSLTLHNPRPPVRRVLELTEASQLLAGPLAEETSRPTSPPSGTTMPRSKPRWPASPASSPTSTERWRHGARSSRRRASSSGVWAATPTQRSGCSSASPSTRTASSERSLKSWCSAALDRAAAVLAPPVPARSADTSRQRPTGAPRPGDDGDAGCSLPALVEERERSTSSSGSSATGVA